MPDTRKTGDQETDTVLALRELVVSKDHIDYFSDEETKTQKGKVIDSRSHSW